MSTKKQLLQRIRIYLRDLKNIIRYGWSAPRYKERIWVDPNSIEFMIDREEVKRITGIHRNQASGIVVDWDQVKNLKPIEDQYRIEYCIKHWEKGKSWEELGVIDFMSKTKKYGDWPREKIKARFEMLDKAYNETMKLGRLKTRKEINPKNFREEDGILVHIAKDGKPVFGGNGFHRLAIGRVLKLDKVPAEIGIVDKNSIHFVKKYRKN